MKIRILIILICITNLNTKAQVYFGLNAGPNMGNIVTKIDSKKDSEIKSAVGYIISGDVIIPVSSYLLFVTGLQFESIHNKVNTESFMDFGGGFTIKETFSGKSFINFVNIPVKLFYKMPLGKSSFIIGAGPNLGIGVGGMSKSTDITETTSGGNTNRNEYNYKEKIKFGSADTAVKRINFGIGINLGFILANNIKFSAYSNIGLLNINNKNKYSTKTIAYGLTVGYVFGKQE